MQTYPITIPECYTSVLRLRPITVVIIFSNW